MGVLIPSTRPCLWTGLPGGSQATAWRGPGQEGRRACGRRGVQCGAWWANAAGCVCGWASCGPTRGANTLTWSRTFDSLTASPAATRRVAHGAGRRRALAWRVWVRRWVVRMGESWGCILLGVLVKVGSPPPPPSCCRGRGSWSSSEGGCCLGGGSRNPS